MTRRISFARISFPYCWSGVDEDAGLFRINDILVDRAYENVMEIARRIPKDEIIVRGKAEILDEVSWLLEEEGVFPTAEMLERAWQDIVEDKFFG